MSGGRRLGWRATILLVVGVLGVSAMGGAVPFALRARRIEAEKRAKTENLLRRRHALVRTFFSCDSPPRSNLERDPTGMRAYWAGCPSFGGGVASTDSDAWGNSIHYAAPGPIHARGWDLWSCGPNGVDELGTGDDILVGQDVANVSSAERQMVEWTVRGDLCDWGFIVRAVHGFRGWVPRAGGDADDPFGERALDRCRRSSSFGGFRDQWGRSLQYRAPGPLHREGWDLWSCGPNGIDEQGDGDDLVLGADLAAVRS